MPLSYVKLYADTSGAIDLLSDAEAGRLFKAILHGIAGVEDKLPGQERLVYAMLKAQFERDAEAYDRFSDKQRSNGAKGGRPKKPNGFSENPNNPTVFSENPENPTVFQKTQKSQDKDKEEDKEEDKEDVVVVDNPFGDNNSNSRPDFNTLEAYASANLMAMSPRNMEELVSYSDTLSDDLIRYAIDAACANGKRSYAYVRAILNRYVEQGYKTVGDAKANEQRRQKGGAGREYAEEDDFY